MYLVQRPLGHISRLAEGIGRFSCELLLSGYGITPKTVDHCYITHYGTLRGPVIDFGLVSLGRNDINANISLFVS